MRVTGYTEPGADMPHRRVRVAVMRHGERFAGQPDPGLTPAGRRMAEEAGQWLREQGFHPTLIFHSPTRRTRETAEAVGQVFPEVRRQALPTTLEDEREWEVLMGDPMASNAAIIGHHPLIVSLQERYGPPPVSVPVHHYACVLLLERGPRWTIRAAWPGRAS